MIIYRCLAIHQQWQKFVTLLSQFYHCATVFYDFCQYRVKLVPKISIWADQYK